MYELGLWLLLHFLQRSPATLKHVLGGFFLAFAGLRALMDWRTSRQGAAGTGLRLRGQHPWPLMLGWMLTGAVSGMMSGVFGVGGPPTMVFMTMARMDKGAMRATNQAGNIALQLVRLVSLLDTGVLKLEPQTLLLMGTLVCMGLSGARAGDSLHGAISTALVVRLILVLLLLGSAGMIVDLRAGSAATDSLVGAMALVVAGSLLLVVVSRCRQPAVAAQGAGPPRAGSEGKRSGGPDVGPGARLCDRVFYSRKTASSDDQL